MNGGDHQLASGSGYRLEGGIPSAGMPRSRRLTLPPLSVEGWDRQQQQIQTTSGKVCCYLQNKAVNGSSQKRTTISESL